MEHKAADYYDVPFEWLPSANFAGRPSREISDINFLEGLWTFMASSPSSLDTDTDIVHELSSEPPQQLTSPGMPSILVTAPGIRDTETLDEPRDELKFRKRQRTARKAATAPPGSLALPDYAPQVPRRVISLRVGSLETNGGKKLRLARDALFTRKADVGTFCVPVDALRQHARPAWALPQALQPKKQKMKGGSWLEVPEQSSFSQKDRIQRTFEGRDIKRLNTDGANLETSGRRTSALSIMMTPRELYGTQEQRSIGLSDGDSQRSHVVKSPDPGLRKASPYPPPTDKQGRQSPNIKVGLRNQRQKRTSKVYIPGPIRLEGHPAKPRRDSVATLDPFDKVIEPKGQRFSDLVGLDNIVMYFEELGVVDEATEGCVDQYWVDSSRKACHHSGQSSVSHTKDGAPTSPWTRRHTSSSGSRFSFSSGSSGASQPRSWATPIRQRIKLKRLLSPGLPGSAFHKAPAKSDANKDER